jgi:uncharacterized membrane protein YfcA
MSIIIDNDFLQKITGSLVIVIAIVAILPTTFVYAQTTTADTNATTTNATTTNATTTNATKAPIQLVIPSAAAQQIINNTKAECQQAQFLHPRCVVSVYESPTTVVVNGLVSIFGGVPGSRGFYPNPFIWKAVDGFKAQGYTITDIVVTMGGNKSSDSEFNVIMSK